MKRLTIFLATLLVAAVAVAPTALASGAVRGDAAFTSNALPRNDDGSTGPVDIGFTANFYGVSTDKVFVNNNGNLTLDEPLSEYTPFPLLSTTRKIIAPFLGDVDTRNTQSGVTTYGIGSVEGRTAFAANWIDVGYYNSAADKLNSFQVVLIDRSDIAVGDFDIEFNYQKIQWETGGASGGVNGLGGSSARAGWSNGTDSSFELVGSAINGAFLDDNPTTGLIHNSLGSTTPGRYAFQVRSGVVEDDPACTDSSVSIGQPINPAGTSTFKRGSTIPVKLVVTCDGELVTGLAPTLSLAQIGATGGGSVNEVVSSSAANDGTTMRWSDSGEQYIYNLSTKRSEFNQGQGLTAGRYELTISDPSFADVVVEFDLAR